MCEKRLFAHPFAAALFIVKKIMLASPPEFLLATLLHYGITVLLRLLHALARDVEFQDHAVMSQTIDSRGRGHGIFEDLILSRKRQPTGQRYAATLVALP